MGQGEGEERGDTVDMQAEDSEVEECSTTMELFYDESIFSQRMSSVVIQTYCSPSGHHFSTSFLLASSCLLAPPLDSCNSNTAGVVRSGSETMH